VTPIFPDKLLQEYYSNFNSSSAPNFIHKKAIIESWVAELRSGKLDSLKEEEVKSRFVTNLFGDVLDFNYGNSNYWLMREEAKTQSDGTKPDVALGYFAKDKTEDDVRAVIEIKDAKTDLDKKQTRAGNKSPVDQAFEYAPKMGGNCKWVIVSNFREIRFYSATDRNKCQVYFLEDLKDSNVFKELLFLFHKEKFISKAKPSNTDKLYEASKTGKTRKSIKNQTNHILEDLYNCLFRFDGLGFVDPNYICTLYPFNILDEHVWHYEDEALFTINKDIYNLLQHIEVVEGIIKIDDELKDQLIQHKVQDYEEKLKWVFQFLNKSLVYNIIAIEDYLEVEKRRKNTIGFTYAHTFYYEENEGLKKNIHLTEKNSCDCLSCNYRSFDFKHMLKKLKMNASNVEHDDFEYAYGNYLVSSNDFKNCYKIYKNLEKDYTKEGKGIAYFLSKLNINYLHNLVRGYYFGDDQKEILQDIRAIDLYSIISDLDFEIDNEVRKYLLQVKEEKLFIKVREEVRKINLEVDKLKKFYDDGNGHQTGRGSLPLQLHEQYILLYYHINKNFIIQDTFSEYKNLVKDIFSGLVQSYVTKEVGLQKFNEFYIAEAVMHIYSEDLEKILKPVSSIKINEECFEKLLVRFNNYFTSFYNTSSFAFDPYENELMTEYQLNDNFKNRLKNLFDNIFIILTKCEVNEKQFASLEKSIVPFIQLEKILYWKNLDYFCSFLIQKGFLFKSDSLLKLFQIAVTRDKPNNNKYERVVKNTCLAIHKFYPEVVISNQALVWKAIGNCYSLTSDRTEFRNYMYLHKIADESCKALLITAIDEDLDKKFKEHLYSELIREGIYHYEYKDYFDKYVVETNKMKGYGVVFKNEKIDTQVSNFIFFNFALQIHAKEINLSETNLAQFTHLSDFEKWLLNPIDFDYNHFEIYWLRIIHHKSAFMKKIAGLEPLRKILQNKLKSEFDQELSDLYVKFFI